MEDLLQCHTARFLRLFEENIKRDGADALLDWLKKSDFFKAPASTKYHGAYEGGLLEHDLLRPAVYGQHFFVGMEIGDLVIGANEHIYVLEHVEKGTDGEPRAHFTKLECATRKAIDSRPNRNGRIYAPDVFASATIRHAIWQSLRAYPQTAQPVHKKNEDELSAGDTKLLDEYLHSFMQPGA